MVNFALLIYCHIGGYNDTVKRYSKNITIYLKTLSTLQKEISHKHHRTTAMRQYATSVHLMKNLSKILTC